MVQVTLWGSLRDYTDGRNEVEVAGDNIYQILQNLGQAEPRLKPILEKGVTVSLDGQIYRQNLMQTVRPDSEVFILPKMAGG
ncbi:MoaD/ThiS family protein [Marivibrio halodurans]|uniref:MoaD/ThiS family protein n=1 Tax=Marivibrio halodurans TaxID=2039722 RepID=A0A8J7RYU1_9PROT|nr:MoaD/ThiS family protein [Marivibrio halodurans]MBP5856855.1 MoaD/ThiS family protein [Marivibrio halodurans]